MATRTTSTGASAARERLLQTATELFYREGIHSVGVDRIVGAAGVTRATFYRHFPSKEDLVEAYLGVEDAAIRGAFDGARQLTDDPRELVGLVIAGLGDDVARRHTRGCPFINAAAEYPDGEGPVRTMIDEHREWFRSTLEQVAGAAGLERPAEVAASLVLLRDAALVGGYLDGDDRVSPAFERTAQAVIAAHRP